MTARLIGFTIITEVKVMENIGTKLKEIRESKKFTRKDVAERLRERGFDISDKTLYGYECGRTNANADLFMALCDIYGIEDILSVFGYNGYSANGSIILSKAEYDLIETYRELDESGKDVVNQTAYKEHQLMRLKMYAELLNEDKIYEREHNEKKE